VKLVYVRRSLFCASVMVLLFNLMACSSTARVEDAAGRSATQTKLNESLVAAEKYQKMGSTDKAFEQLDAAIKLDPASKEPWLRKAQIHFDLHLYGAAISDSQEVLQRDVNDLTAQSTLAVSGLRVSAQALEQLRKANEVTGSTRSEAESVARIIREALGEPILIPPTAAGTADSGAKGKSSYGKGGVHVTKPPLPRPPTGAAAPVASKSTGAAANGVTPPPGGRNNPFGALQ
jgi:hypothetical protein